VREIRSPPTALRATLGAFPVGGELGESEAGQSRQLATATLDSIFMRYSVCCSLEVRGRALDRFKRNQPLPEAALFRWRKFTDRSQSLDWMSMFEVQCVAGEDHFCIEVPTDCLVGDVLKKASEHSELKGASLWYSDIELNCDHLFADYYEPEGVCQVKVRGSIPEGTSLKLS
jgi:hypothetical protein